MREAVPGIEDAVLTDDPLMGWHCCMVCRKEIKRREFPDPFKRPGQVIRPLPVCRCLTEAEDREREWRERLDRKRKLQRTYAKNIIAAGIENARFENFIIRPGTERAHEKSVEFCKGFGAGRKTGLVLFGTVGNGKSHLARAIERRVDAEGWATLFLDWPQLSELAKATFNGGNVTVADYIRAALDADLLVLDEIGLGYLTEWEYKNLLFPILNGRSGKATVYTTNLDPDRLEEWFAKDKEGRPLDEYGRMIDRILGGCDIVLNKGTSKRKEDANKRRQLP